MYPTLFKIGKIPLFSYGFFLAIGFLLAIFCAVDLAKRYQMSRDDVLDLGMWGLISGIVGARLLYILFNFSYYWEHPLEIILLNKGGLIFYGGLFGGIAGGIHFLKKRSFPILKVGDILACVLPIGQMFGRIGCFLNGCCFGTPCVYPFKVIFPGNSPAFHHYHEFQPVHPVQLYESLGMGVIFLVLVTIFDRKKFDGELIVFYGFLYSGLRFFMEFFRGDNERLWLNITFSGWVSIVFFVCSFFLYLRLRPKKV